MKFIKSLKGYLQIKKEKNLDVVFYSESKSYYINFKNIIEELINKKIKVYYVTSSEDDKVFNMENDYFKPIYIGSNFFIILFFNYLKANMLITTLPDIDFIFQLFKSKYVNYNITRYRYISS